MINHQNSLIKHMKKLEPIIHEDGVTILVMDADEANSDWLASRRLSPDELKDKLERPMWVEDD